MKGEVLVYIYIAAASTPVLTAHVDQTHVSKIGRTTELSPKPINKIRTYTGEGHSPLMGIRGTDRFGAAGPGR